MNNLRAKIPGFTLLLAGLALCGAGLWLLLSPARYQAVTRLRIDPYPKSSEARVYDEDFIQIEIEVIESEAVLRRVVRNLNLNEHWGKNHTDGHQLETGQSVKLLKKQISVQAIPHTVNIEIRVTSIDSGEAAKIANAITEAYLEYRMEQWRQLAAQEIQTLTDLYQRQLNSWLEFLKLLAAKIEAEKLNLPTQKSLQDEIKIVALATPSQTPVGPNRMLGALLFAIGLFSSVGGFALLKSSGRQSD